MTKPFVGHWHIGANIARCWLFLFEFERTTMRVSPKPYMQTENKFLIALLGPVGSGKSYIAKILSKKLNALHIRTDDIRMELHNKAKSYNAAPRIAAQRRDQALQAGKSVIADFVINNDKPIAPQIQKIVDKIRAHS